jgi:hypothetical protein
VSLYPSREADLSPTIDAAIAEIKRRRVKYPTGEMGTVPCRDDQKLFAALPGVPRGASRGHVAMTRRLSNACPWPGKADREQEGE